MEWARLLKWHKCAFNDIKQFLVIRKHTAYTYLFLHDIGKKKPHHNLQLLDVFVFDNQLIFAHCTLTLKTWLPNP